MNTLIKWVGKEKSTDRVLKKVQQCRMNLMLHFIIFSLLWLPFSIGIVLLAGDPAEQTDKISSLERHISLIQFKHNHH